MAASSPRRSDSTDLSDHFLRRVFRKGLGDVVLLQRLSVESGLEVDGRDLTDEAVALLGPAADDDVTDGDDVSANAVLFSDGGLNF